jgi:type VI protein secretion system component VasK
VTVLHRVGPAGGAGGHHPERWIAQLAPNRCKRGGWNRLPGGQFAIALVSLGLSMAWLLSYRHNRVLIDEVDAAAAAYTAAAGPYATETVIADREVHRVLPLLDALRNLPAGYAVRKDWTPLSATFGLSQRERLQSAGKPLRGVTVEEAQKASTAEPFDRLEAQVKKQLDRIHKLAAQKRAEDEAKAKAKENAAKLTSAQKRTLAAATRNEQEGEEPMEYSDDDDNA